MQPRLAHRSDRRFRPRLELLEGRCVPAVTGAYAVTNLVSDEPGQAALLDPNLVNPWGLSLGPTGGNFWVSDNGTGVSTLYSGDVGGTPLSINPLVVTIPQGVPTGQAFNPTNDFVVTDGTNSGKAF